MPWSMEQKIFCVKTYYETKSFRIVQARFRRKFSFNQFPNRSQIFKLVKKFEAHGTCGDRRVAGSSPSGPPITICTPDNVSRVQESVGRSPTECLSSFGESSISVRTLMRKNSGSSKMVPLLTLLMSPWLGSVKSLESVSSAAKLKWNGHLTRLT